MAKIPIILEPGRADGKLVTTNSIFDENKSMFQSELNDIQDTLNSDNSNKPLSANQGKVLKGLLDAKVIEAGAVPMDPEPTEGNVNNVVSSDGIYKSLLKKVDNVTFEEKNKHQDEKLSELELGVGFDISCILTGNGQNYVRKAIKVLPNTEYVIKPLATLWKVDKNTLGYSCEVFSIYDGTTNKVTSLLLNGESSFIPLNSSYTIVTSSETTELKIGGRASSGVEFGITYYPSDSIFLRKQLLSEIEKHKRSFAYAMSCNINFDNTKKSVSVNVYTAIDKTGNLHISDNNLAYAFDVSSTDVWCVVYDTTTQSCLWKTQANLQHSDIILSIVLITGKAESGFVQEVLYTPSICITKIDNVPIINAIDAYSSYFTGGNKPEITKKGTSFTIMMPSAEGDVLCWFIASKTTPVKIPVNSETYTIPSSNKLVYSINENKFKTVSIGTSRRSYVDCLVNNGGYLSGGVFAHYYFQSENDKNSIAISDLPNTPIINLFKNNGWFVDHNVFKKLSGYDSIVIPVTGGAVLDITANSEQNARVALLNSLDLDSIEWGKTVIDGTSNFIIPIDTSKTITCQGTCKYIVLSSVYENKNSLPSNFKINGNDVYKSNLDALTLSYQNIKGSLNLYGTGKGSTYISQEVKLVAGVTYSIKPVKLEEDDTIYPGYAGATRFEISKIKDDTTSSIVNVWTHKGNTIGTLLKDEYIVKAEEGATYKIGYRAISGSEVYIQISEYIDYYGEMLNDIIKRNFHKDSAIRTLGTTVRSGEIKPLGFMHISDIHTRYGTNGSDYKCLRNARKLMELYSNIKFGIITGDIIYDHFKHSMEYYNDALKDFEGIMLNVIGNHDAGQWHDDLGSVGTDEQVYQKYIAPYESKWNLSSNTGKSYYYKDFTDEKVRLIVLYEFETDFEISSTNPNNLRYEREYRAMRQTQIDWLIQSLNDTPEDYGVIVAYHMPDKMADEDNNFVSDYLKGYDSPNFNYASDRNFLLKIFDAFQKKKAIDFTFNQTGGVVTTLHVQADFTQKQSEFICVLAGHTHDDYIGHFYNYPDILLLVAGANNLHYSGRYCPRVYNTISEDLINLVNVDRNRKTVTVIRVGSDVSITGQDRKMIRMSYLPKS